MKNKSFIYLIVFATAILWNSCIYRKASVAPDSLFTGEELIRAINKGRYDVYVNHGTTSFRMKDPKLENGMLSGKAVRLKKPMNDPENKRELHAHKKDIFIKADSVSTDKLPHGAVNLRVRQADVKAVSMVEGDAQNKTKKIAFLIALLTVTAALVYYFITVLIPEAAGAVAASAVNNSCYIATMVYGSYDAPEVFVLRRFRDRFLKKFLLGKLFIVLYYRYSPLFVARFKNVVFVNKAVRFMLNPFVRLLAWIGYRN